VDLVKRINLAVALTTGNYHITALVIIENRPDANFLRRSVTADTVILIIEHAD